MQSLLRFIFKLFGVLLTLLTLSFVIIPLLFFVSKNFLYTSLVTYENPVNRGHSGYGLYDKELLADISEWASENEDASIQKIHKKAVKLTAEKLSFKLSASSSMSSMYKSEKANCVGYSKFYCSAFNSITKELGLRDKYSCSHMVAEIHLVDYNLHDLFTSRSFKNHDFNVIKDSKGQVLLATDPSLYDYSYISAASIGQN